MASKLPELRESQIINSIFNSSHKANFFLHKMKSVDSYNSNNEDGESFKFDFFYQFIKVSTANLSLISADIFVYFVSNLLILLLCVVFSLIFNYTRESSIGLSAFWISFAAFLILFLYYLKRFARRVASGLKEDIGIKGEESQVHNLSDLSELNAKMMPSTILGSNMLSAFDLKAVINEAGITYCHKY